ncbi:hypothetical protein [Sphingomonas abaci]|uniref:Uncharacterized protein n=1 Tax=Sphingomonas abaci TaxID=237611 RepID=A0A7W7EYZ7_9SPHN|nr:hypothetical protein [Sphingomonas abaci]MBB4616880.1 hypothetical protein [Sphingomonas abaci]
MPVLPALMLIAARAPDPGVDKAPACAASNTGTITPADMLQRLDDFRARLGGGARERLDRALPRDASDGIKACVGNVDRSEASCENGAYFRALRRTGLMARFKAGLCPGSAAGYPLDDRPASGPDTARQ